MHIAIIQEEKKIRQDSRNSHMFTGAWMENIQKHMCG